MRSLAELTPAAAASSSLETVGSPGLGERREGPQVDRQPGDGGLGDVPGAVGGSPCGHCSSLQPARSRVLDDPVKVERRGHCRSL